MKKHYVFNSLLLSMLFLLLGFAKLGAQTIWDGTADVSWYDEYQNYFDIYTPQELAGLAQLVNSGHDFSGVEINLQDDIWLNADNSTLNNWTMIGGNQTATTKETYANFFRGTFHGNGHYIYNMYCSRDNGNGGFYFQAGLFGALKNPCTIDSLVLVNPITRAQGGFQGGLAACIAPGGNVTISKVLVINANINQNQSSVDGHNGCIIGGVYPNESYTTYINNCGATGTVRGQYVGGLTGGAGGGIFTNCYFYGTVSCSTSWGGGGIASHGGTANNCYSNISGGSGALSGSGFSGVSLTNPSASLGDAFRADCLLPINGGYPLLDWMECNDPTCGPVTNLFANDIQGSSVQINWTPSHIGTPMDYTIEYSENGTDNWTTITGITASPYLLENLEPNTLYQIRVMSNCDDGSSSEYTLGSFSTTCMCGQVGDIIVENVMGTSAQLSWSRNNIGTLTDYTLEYSEAGMENWTSVYGITTEAYLLGGLEPSTAYDIRIMANCDNGYTSFETSTTILTHCLVTEAVTIGNGTETAVQYPVNNFYKYSYSQQIFTAAEMGFNPQMFSGISFEYSYSTPTTSKNNVKIYLGHTTKTSFSGTSDYVPFDSLHLVYSGNLNCQQGWNEFTFTAPFNYNGTDNLVVVVDDDSYGYDGSSYTFYTHGTNGDMCHALYSDSYNPEPTNISSFSGSNNVYSSRNNIKFHYCNEGSTCAVPSVMVTNVTSEEAEIVWVPGYQESAWELEYKMSSESDWTSYGSVSSMDEIISNLNPNTMYDVRMRSDCGGEYSNWIVVSFRTLCGPITQLPFVENFNSYSTGNMPDCWTLVTSNSNYHHVTAHNTNCIISAGNTIIASPAIAENIESLQVSFDFEREGASSGTLDFGIMTDITNPNSFELIQHYDPEEDVSIHQLVYLNEVAATGPGRFLAFRQNSTVTNYYYWIDNVSVDYIPACVPPTMTVGTVGVDEATFNWNDDHGAQTEWEFVYGVSGFDPNSAVGTPVYGTPTITLSGLNNNTHYDAYVRANCGSEYSDWSPVVNFLTLAGMPATTPYLCDFEDADENGTWVLQNGSETNKWYIGMPTGISDSVLFISQDGTSTSYNTSSTSNVWAYRDIQFGDGAEFNLSFKWKCHGESSYDYIQVFIGNPTEVTAGSNAQPAGSVQLTFPRLNLQDNWQTFSTMFNSSYANTTKRLYFLWHNDGSSGTAPGAVIDSVQVSVSDCGRPSNLTASNVTADGFDITFSPALATDGSWEYVVCANGANPDNETPDMVSTTTFTVAGLSASSTYNIYVRTVCDNGGYSVWSNMLSVTTDCGPITQLPFTETFDTPDANNYVNCWSRYASDPAHYVYLYGDVVPPTGHYSLDFHWTPNCFNIAIMPQIDDNINVSDLMASFWIQRTGSSSMFEVGVMTNKDDYTTFEPLDTIASPIVNQWDYIYFPFSQYVGSGKYIAFRVSNGTDCGFRMDDITLDYIPSCMFPAAVQVSNITDNEAQISWTENGTATEWIIEYDTTGFTPGNGQTVAVTTNPYTLTGLTNSYSYDVYVRANCGGGDVSNNSSVATFNTEICSPSDQCAYTLNLNDSYGDGWNGNAVQVYSNGIYVNSYTISTGSSATFTVNLCDQSAVTLKWVTGNYASETSFELVDPFGDLIYSVQDGNTLSGGSVIYTMTANCVPPTCPRPRDLHVTQATTSSVTLAWTENGSANSWNIEYGPAGFTPGQGTTDIATTNPYIVTGLTTATAYDFYIQADCGSDDVSEWSSVATATTDCDVIATFPFTENFDASTSLPDCWNNVNVTGSTEWEVSTPDEGSVVSAHSGNNSVIFFQDDEGDQADLQMPTLDLTSLTNPVLTFWYTNESWSGDIDELTVYYRTSATDTWSQLTSHTSGASTWTFDSLALPNPSANYQIKFHATSNYGYGINIDDVTIMEANSAPGTTCDAPTNVAATNVAQTSATINWQAGGSETAWNLQYKAASAANWSNSITVNTTPTYAISGLTANTAYQVRVQASCGAGQTSDWTTANFTTLDDAQCPAPTNFRAEEITNNGVTLAWDQAAGTANEWEINYKAASATTWTNITVTTNPYTISDLTSETAYQAQILAHCVNGVSSDASEIITFTTLPNGINNYVLDNSTSLYPNPTTGLFTISNEQCTMNSVNVYDVYGKLLMSVEVNGNIATIDATSFSAGVYFAKVETAKGVVTKRFVKK